MRTRFLAASVLCLSTWYGAEPTRADYLIDLTGSETVLLGAGSDDDLSARQSLPFAFQYFGTNYTANNFKFFVDTNGRLDLRPPATASSSAAGGTPLSSLLHNYPMIDPLWDDMALSGSFADQKVVAGTDGTTYFAVTWQVETFGLADQFEFQVVLFGGDTTLGGYDFEANDIVFAYKTLGSDFSTNDATVGISLNNTTFATPFPSTDGRITSPSDIALAPNEFFLFRFNPTTGGYAVSVPVPEPSTLALVGLGLGGILAVSVRRRLCS